MTFSCNAFDFFQLLATPITIAIVGYWVNVTIRKKNQRGSIVIDYLQALQTSIHKLIDNAVNSENLEECTKNLRSLSNEINHLIDLYIFFNKNNQQNKQDRLRETLIDVKRHLTTSGRKADGEDLERARQSSNKLRRIVLDILLNICDSQN